MHSYLRRQGGLDCILEPDGRAQVHAIGLPDCRGTAGLC